MKGKLSIIGIVALGCAPEAKPPTPVTVLPPTPVERPAVVKTVIAPAPAPAIAIVDPYLIAVAIPRLPSPSPLRGEILQGRPLPDASPTPIVPEPPTRTDPMQPPASSLVKPAPTPNRGPSTVPPAVVRLFESERARSVDDARRRLDAATTRANQAAAEAKRLWGFVKDGFVAQKQADAADAAARDATTEQAAAQKAFDDAQQRQRNARRDIDVAMRVIASLPSSFVLAQSTILPKTLQPVPGLYRLSVLGIGPVRISVQNGTVGKRLDPAAGEAGVWLLRCPDPTQLRIGVGTQRASVIVRSLPPEQPTSKV